MILATGWPDIPGWVEFLLTAAGSWAGGFLSALFAFTRALRRVEKARATDHAAIDLRITELERVVGTEKDGDGLYGRIVEVKMLVQENGESEHRHNNRMQRAMLTIGAKLSLDLGDAFRD